MKVRLMIKNIEGTENRELNNSNGKYKILIE